jgi:FkbM family methyltransferase
MSEFLKRWKRRGRDLFELPSRVRRLANRTDASPDILSRIDKSFVALGELRTRVDDPSLFGPLVARLDALQAAINSLHHEANADRDRALAQAAELADLRAKITELQRSAASRGNILLPNNRLLTRISLPQFFPHYDPILFVNADDKLIVPKLAMNGYYELESSHFVARNVKPNDHCVDVGANFGYYTAMMGVLVGWKGKVVAFEPQPDMATLLQENTLINWIEPWVKIVRAACSEGPGTMRLFTSKARAANTGMTIPEIAEGYGGDFAFTPLEAPTVAVDDELGFLEGRVDFMKIDVEGAEPLALRGARKTIAANPGIKILMEWSPGQLTANGFALQAVVEELKATGLACHSLHISGEVGVAAPMPFEALPEAGYQNIVLMRDLT